jgi:hypothetical protein
MVAVFIIGARGGGGQATHLPPPAIFLTEI